MRDIQWTIEGFNWVGFTVSMLVIVGLLVLGLRWMRKPETRRRGYAIVVTLCILVAGAFIALVARTLVAIR